MTTTTTPAFEVGEIYEAHSPGDWNCIWRFLVVKRTAKFITLQELDDVGHDAGAEFRVGALPDAFGAGGEWAKPFGTYSLCPVIRAENRYEGPTS